MSGPVGIAVDPTDRVVFIIREARQSAFARWFDPEGRVVKWFADHGWFGKYPPGQIYLANHDDDTIRGAPLDGSGSPDTLYGGADHGVHWPNFLAVLRAPVGTGPPMISGTGSRGQQLRCSRGTWAANLVGCLLYRTPQSFRYQWLLGGADIAGATLSAYTPANAGSYSCRVTAVNQAGSATQTSAAITVP